MEDDREDVNQEGLESSDDPETDKELDELESEEGTEEGQPDSGVEEAEKPDEPSLKEQLAKEREEKANLLKALQEKRHSERFQQPTLIEPSQPSKKPEQSITADELVRAMVASEEEAAKQELYKEYPELHPDNDPNNEHYQAFVQDFTVAARVKGVRPVKKEQFLELGRLVMGLRGRSQDVDKVKADAQAEAHREHLKAETANLSTGRSQRTEAISATDADRRAARTVGMPVEEYLKYKDQYADAVEPPPL